MLDQLLADAESVHGHVRRICFKTGPPGKVGAELEWLVARRDDPRAVVPLARLEELLAGAGPMPAGSRTTLEPGGQVELSSVPSAGPAECRTALARDVDRVQQLLGADGLRLVPSGIDPDRPPRRQLHRPRYDAMAAYFSRLPHRLGPVMMASTAAVQVNLDAGADAADVRRRWELLHRVGPTLSAAFANSPRRHGRRTGWKSTRQAVWWRLDPPRTAAPPPGDPVDAWCEYALAAPVMMLRRDSGPWTAAPGFTFGHWVDRRPTGLPAPTVGDLEYHLGTLFPPVRPRGWFEVRYLDAQPVRWWPVPVTVLATLLAQPRLGQLAAEACEPVTGRWLAAARHGLGDAALARAAAVLFSAVADAVTEPDLREEVTAFTERFVLRGRCPADDDLSAEDDSGTVPAPAGRNV